jgi:hypothetical protein
MPINTMNLQPGTRVRILEHQMNIVDDHTHILIVYATKDSIGTTVAYEEYRVDVVNREKHGVSVNPRHLAWVKSEMESGTHYPIKLTEFVLLPADEYAKLKQDFLTVTVLSQVGAFVILPLRRL